MKDIFTDITAAQSTVDGDLAHRRMLIQAGEELKTSPALQYVLQQLYHKQANNLLTLGVTQADADNGFQFMLAHNNVQARLDTLKTIWLLGQHSEQNIAEYRAITATTQPDQEI